MRYSVKTQRSQDNDDTEYLVINESGALVPHPHTFSTPGEAEARRAELELAAEQEFVAKWNAGPAAPGHRYYGKIRDADGDILVQNLGKRYVFHRRTQSRDLAELEVGKTVWIKDGQVTVELEQGSELEL